MIVQLLSHLAVLIPLMFQFFNPKGQNINKLIFSNLQVLFIYKTRKNRIYNKKCSGTHNFLYILQRIILCYRRSSTVVGYFVWKPLFGVYVYLMYLICAANTLIMN